MATNSGTYTRASSLISRSVVLYDDVGYKVTFQRLRRQLDVRGLACFPECCHYTILLLVHTTHWPLGTCHRQRVLHPLYNLDLATSDCHWLANWKKTSEVWDFSHHQNQRPEVASRSPSTTRDWKVSSYAVISIWTRPITTWENKLPMSKHKPALCLHLKNGETQLLTLPHTHFSCVVSVGFAVSRSQTTQK